MPEPRLADDLVERVLARLRLPRVERTAEGLAALYRAWCQQVPWDNVQKRISIAERRPVLAGSEPGELLENLLAHGTGGTCWPSAGALHALVRAAGFDARRAVGAMLYDVHGKQPNHGTTIVRVDGEAWLVDSSILNGRPLPLRRERTAIDDPLHAISAEPHPDGLWLVWWQAHNRDERVSCLIYEDHVPHEAFVSSYEASRVTGFSYSLTFHKGSPDGFLTLGKVRTWKDRSGTIAVSEIADRVQALVDAGVSRDAAARLPPDEPNPSRAG